MDTNLVFNEFGTLTAWKGVDCFYPYTPTGDSFRGGAFWCIPNQGQVYDTFEKQNGEYRKTVAQGNSMAKNLSGKWGNVITNVEWHAEGNTLTTKATMTALHDKSLLRPGFHPYFAVSGNFEIEIDHHILTKDTIRLNETKTVVIQKFAKATLTNEYSIIEISYKTETPEKDPNITFCIWTDDKDKYVCIEPVIGKGELFDGSPAPISMHDKKTIVMTATITVTPR